MKELRRLFSKVRDSFLDASVESRAFALSYMTIFFVISILLILILVLIVLAFIVPPHILIIYGILLFLLELLSLCNKVKYFIYFSTAKFAFYFFKKYGRVVTKADWKRIKKQNLKLYKLLNSDKSRGFCYFYSRALALYLTDAKLLFCNILLENKTYTAHSVVVKNNCVYDTNFRAHLAIDDYIKLYDVHIYKYFSREEYEKEDFFANVRDDFVAWCKKHNTYVLPE